MSDDMSDEQSPYDFLLAVQDEDLHIDRLQHRIDRHPSQAEIASLHDRSVALDKSTVQTRIEQGSYSLRQEEIEREVVELDRRIGEIDDRLRGDSSGSFRDQEAMSNEMSALASQKRILEDEELTLMELLEPIDAQLNAVGAEQITLRHRAQAMYAEMSGEKVEIAAEIAQVMERRTALAEKLPASLLNEYEKLRKHLGGVGAARLVHGMCSGCNLSLSASEVDRLVHGSPDKLVHCEQCGRILVP